MRTTLPFANPKINVPHHIEPSKDKLDTVRSGAHSKYNLNTHFVTIPKYRRQILREPKFKEILKEIWEGQAESRGWKVLAFEIQPDHIHSFLSVPPQYSTSYVMNILKGNTSIQLRRIFPDMIRKYQLGDHLWAKGFWASSAGYISEDSVRKYINEQEHHRLKDEWNKAHPKDKQKRIG